MLAARWEAIEDLKLADVPEPEAGPGEALIEVARCGICGSDLHSWREGFAASPGQVLGHELAGTVVEAPGVPGLAAGTLVTVRPLIPCGECGPCRAGLPQHCERGLADGIGYGRPGGFAERVLVPRAVVGETVFPLAAGLDARAGALVEPLAVALHAVRRAAARREHRALVLGAGTIGLGVVAFLRDLGVAELAVSDPSRLRREAAARLGADRGLDPAAGPLPPADLIFDCAGGTAALRQGLRAAVPGATVVLSAVYGRRVEVALDVVLAKELEVRGAFAYADEFAAVIAALERGAVDVDALVSHELPLAEIERAFALQGDPAASLKVLVVP